MRKVDEHNRRAEMGVNVARTITPTTVQVSIRDLTCTEENVGSGGMPMDVHDFLLVAVEVDDCIRHVLLPDQSAI